jgi:hypothetical protein
MATIEFPDHDHAIPAPHNAAAEEGFRDAIADRADGEHWRVTHWAAADKDQYRFVIEIDGKERADVTTAASALHTSTTEGLRGGVAAMIRGWIQTHLPDPEPSSWA